MQKSLVNLLYWILVKSAESYYGDSIKKVYYSPDHFKQLFINIKYIKGGL